MKVYIKNIDKTIELENQIKAYELIKYLDFKPYACTVSKRLRELSYVLTNDCEVEFLDLTHSNANRVYEASLRYLVAMAFYKVFNKRLIFNYSVSRSIFALPIDFEKEFDQNDLNKLLVKIDELVQQDLAFERQFLTLEQTNFVYKQQNYLNKLDVLQFREEEYVNAYKCGDYYNYMYSLMVPSTGYLTQYRLQLYKNGFVIQYPRVELKGKIPEFKDQPRYAKTLRTAYEWTKITNAGTISELNKICLEKDKLRQVINMCEIRHTNRFYVLADKIIQNIDKTRLICVAGPSSSGKTTFSTRLRYTLLSLGIKPLMVSIDNYYLTKDLVPKDEDGNPDLESLYSLDIEKFNQDIQDLLKGKEVALPIFDFKQGKRVPGPKVKIDEKTPIIIEGIHALNDKLTLTIPRENKFKVFVGPQTQTHIDDHNPISFTDLRLLRRIVRDSKYRNAKATETLSMWQSVRNGEFKWIYPNEEDADFVFNTELSYEIAVLKKHALPQLQQITRSSQYFITANRLVKFLKYFIDIEDELIPCNSLLREFIGGGCFEQ